MKIERIGYFHFVQHESNSIDALRAALAEEADELNIESVGGVRALNALIVLPEAFNLIGRNQKREESDFDPRVCTLIGQIAIDFKVVFIMSLVIREVEPAAPNPPYNAAFLIDGHDLPLPICRKISSDETAYPNGNDYLPCEVGRDDRCCPIVPRNICIGVMICMDASDPICNSDAEAVQDQRRKLFDCVPNRLKVLCVPARMRSLSNSDIPTRWNGVMVVFANAEFYAHAPSFVSVAGDLKAQSHSHGEVLPDENFMGKRNHIRTYVLPGQAEKK